tara:strand:+ start:1744 stop:2163 length:420 start_codon:yes stop_codon:yes gene_type:complete
LHDRIQDALERLPHRNRIRTCSYYLLAGLFLTGCTATKKAAIVATAAGTGAVAGTVLSGGIAAPMVGATTTAFVADVITEAVPIGQTGKETMNNCAPDNFWTLLGSLVEMGGWLLILVIVAPMVLGWILPGPLERKQRR